jgi:N-acetylneuraminic acid mutarotase
MFGGNGNDSQGNEDVLNDLWEYSPSLNEWSWVGGSNTVDQNGVYGTLGSPGGTNIPGGRAYGASWKDESGNFWLFGGYGLDSVSTDAGGALNDLWEFNTSTAQWTWWGPNASLTINQNGLYGTKGTTGTGNYPGGRYWPSAATDGLGNFWLFGGDGYDATGSQGNPEALNDLWVYSTTSQQWTWISGSNMFGQAPTYGAQGSGNASNVPGARDGSVGWMDSSGDFWLFGGVGIDSQLTYGYLNDTWQYIPSSKEWVWEGPSGSNVRNQPGNYVAIGQAGTPGNREWPSGWLDSSGNFWLFGGQQDGGEGLNDLWEFSANNWTWEGGSSSSNQLGNYPSGGVGNTGTPGARWNSASWIDLTGNLWLFGGEGAAAAYPIGDLNDLWKFVP